MSFKGKVIIITGASSGIGKELALQLAREGAHLVLAARNEQALHDIVETCKQSGAKAIYTVTDVTRSEACEAMVQKAVDEFGQVDVLVNNAGITHWSHFKDTTNLDVMRKIMEANYYGAVQCTHYALPHLLKSKGLIVAVSSLTGITGVPTRTFYAGSKHAMNGFFDSLRIELMGTGVDVTVICPGFVTSEVRARALNGAGESVGESHVQEDKVMSAATCCEIMIKAMRKRKRIEVMTVKGKLGRFLKLIAPGLIDKIALKTIQAGK